MTDKERFGSALVRVQSGESKTSVIRSLYTNWRQYDKRTTASQRAELTRARKEFLDSQPIRPRVRARTILELLPERRKSIETVAKAEGVTLSRFVNSAIVYALSRYESGEWTPGNKRAKKP